MQDILHVTNVKGVATHMLRTNALDHFFFLMVNQSENPMREKNSLKTKPPLPDVLVYAFNTST